jgi:hypothetical protein
MGIPATTLKWHLSAAYRSLQIFSAVDAFRVLGWLDTTEVPRADVAAARLADVEARLAALDAEIEARLAALHAETGALLDQGIAHGHDVAEIDWARRTPALWPVASG